MNDDSNNPLYLLVDDDAVFRERLARALRKRGCQVATAMNADEALDLARLNPPERAVVDLRMPGRSGLELVHELLALDPATQIVVLTGYGSIGTAIDAVRLGATYYLSKPADVDDLLAAFERGSQPVEPATSQLAAPSLARAEWEHIQRVLADADHNISEAARRLGMHRRSLQRKLHKLPPPT